MQRGCPISTIPSRIPFLCSNDLDEQQNPPKHYTLKMYGLLIINHEFYESPTIWLVGVNTEEKTELHEPRGFFNRIPDFFFCNTLRYSSNILSCFWATCMGLMLHLTSLTQTLEFFHLFRYCGPTKFFTMILIFKFCELWL